MVMAVDMNNESNGNIDSQPESAGDDASQAEKPGVKSVDEQYSFHMITKSDDKVAFNELYSATGGRSKWKSASKFIMAGCTLLKKVSAGELVMYPGKASGKMTMIEVIQVSVPGRKSRVVENADDEQSIAEETISTVDDASITNPALSNNPVARYFDLVQKWLIAQKDLEEVNVTMTKKVAAAERSMNNFLDNNWDTLKGVLPKMFAPAIEKEHVERVRTEQLKQHESRSDARKEFGKKEQEAARER